MPDYHSLPNGSRPDQAIRNNGPDALALERYKLRELAEGWPMYRDACEWENFRSMFHPDAYIYTSWTGKTPIEKFIKMSQDGMDKGAFIMHRVHGSSTDINPSATRAVTKMKATITQRFELSGCEVDAEADCRFFYLFEKNSGNGEWRAKYVRHWYEKDKLIPANPRRIPEIDEEKLKKYPRGYRYLAYCWEVGMGVEFPLDLPGHNSDKGATKEKHDLLYWQAKEWLDGNDVDF